jgi:hypothetical protein
MPKLKKEDFDKTFRFREARRNNPREGLVNRVNCTTCTNMSGGSNSNEEANCCHPERFRKVRIAEYWQNWDGKRKNNNFVNVRVCDGYSSKPLPEGVTLPILSECQAILLGSQYADPYHADPTCPYVVEEARMIATTDTGITKRAEIRLIDISEKVPGEVIRDVCDMPCCETKLPFQLLYNPNGYRHKVKLKPDGSEPKIWVRNGIVKHERKVEMTIEEAETFFDLTSFATLKVGLGQIQDRIIAVSNHLHKCNLLGSRPLSEAANPVYLGYHHFLEDSLVGANSGADVWVYDERLFDFKKGLERPLEQLDQIPEGIIPCMDTQKALRVAHSYCRDCHSGTYYVYGIVKPLDNKNLQSKGLTHFIEIGVIHFSGYEHMWGEFGKGFSGLASFHEE